jgi:predicted small lipoprotein YifL
VKRTAGLRLALAAALLACAAGCGLKGPLSLPEKSGEVIIRAPQEQAPESPSPPATPGEAQGGTP